MSIDVFAPWIERWRLAPDGPAFKSNLGNHLLPVTSDGRLALLKISVSEEEVRGGDLMAWYGGQGAAAVFAVEGPALLMERANGRRNLAAMARTGGDDEATDVLCDCAAQLHAPRAKPMPKGLVQIELWFQPLFRAAERHVDTLGAAAAAARGLLAEPRDVVVLHGDLHHGNVLDGEDRGWLAIDPKGLIGERTFDFANIFRNPDADTALQPGRLARRVDLISKHAHVDPARLLRWIRSYAALGAAWSIEDSDDPTIDLTVAELAASKLGE